MGYGLKTNQTQCNGTIYNFVQLKKFSDFPKKEAKKKRNKKKVKIAFHETS